MELKMYLVSWMRETQQLDDLLHNSYVLQRRGRNSLYCPQICSPISCKGIMNLILAIRPAVPTGCKSHIDVRFGHVTCSVQQHGSRCGIHHVRYWCSSHCLFFHLLTLFLLPWELHVPNKKRFFILGPGIKKETWNRPTGDLKWPAANMVKKKNTFF